MLDTSAENLYEEIRQAINLREKHTNLSADLIEQYAGSSWQEGRGPAVESHENHPFEFVQNTLPFLVYYNPKVDLKSSRPRVHRELVPSLKHAMDKWIRDVKFADTLLEVARDTMFDFGVLLVTLEALPGYEDEAAPPLRPALTRISPRCFFQDPQNHSKPRFMGHEWTRDFDDLMNATQKDPVTGAVSHVYNREALAQLAGDHVDDFGKRKDPIMALPSGVNRVARKQVRGFECYVRETGMVYTLGYYLTRDGKRKAVFLRPPRQAFGPTRGAYIVFGIYGIPDQVYPLAPLAVTANLVEELNAQIDQVTDLADQTRTFTLVNATNDKAQMAVQTAKNGDILTIPGFSQDQAQTVTIPGPSSEQLDYVDRLRERLDRKSGITEFMRGNVTGDATARENQLAANAVDVRRKFMRRMFHTDAAKALEVVLWFMLESNNVVFNVPVPKSLFAQAGEHTDDGGEMEDGVFMGGRHEGVEAASLEDLELSIEPYSMELVDEDSIKQTMQAAFALVMQVAPLLVQMPWVNWQTLLDDLFEAHGVRDCRKYFNWALIEKLAQMAQELGAVQQIPGLEGVPMPDVAALFGGGMSKGTGAGKGRPGNLRLAGGAQAGAVPALPGMGGMVSGLKAG